MEYKNIPNTNLHVSVISLGTWAFSGDCWGNINEAECIDAVSTAAEYGINLIDTAPIYGYGKAEEIIGKAIKGRRDKFIIATKCGLLGKGINIKCNLRPNSIKKEVERSLKRLGIEYIDIYQCHWLDPNTPIQDTMHAMLKLKQQGKIKYIGVSNFKISSLKKALEVTDITTLQNQYSLLERGIEKDMAGFCKEKGVSILAYGPLGGGILSGKYKNPPQFKKSDARSFFYKFYKGKEFEKAMEVIETLEEISDKINKPLGQIALNWIWQKETVASAIVGCRNPEQAKLNALAGSWKLAQSDIKKLDAIVRHCE